MFLDNVATPDKLRSGFFEHLIFQKKMGNGVCGTPAHVATIHRQQGSQYFSRHRKRDFARVLMMLKQGSRRILARKLG